MADLSNDLQTLANKVISAINSRGMPTQTQLTSINSFKLWWDDYRVVYGLSGVDLKILNANGFADYNDFYYNYILTHLNTGASDIFSLSAAERDSLINTLEPLGWTGLVSELRAGTHINTILSQLSNNELISLYNTIEPLGWTGLADSINQLVDTSSESNQVSIQPINTDQYIMSLEIRPIFGSWTLDISTFAINLADKLNGTGWSYENIVKVDDTHLDIYITKHGSISIAAVVAIIIAVLVALTLVVVSSVQVRKITDNIVEYQETIAIQDISNNPNLTEEEREQFINAISGTELEEENGWLSGLFTQDNTNTGLALLAIGLVAVMALKK
jgi:hypothetical protein